MHLILALRLHDPYNATVLRTLQLYTMYMLHACAS